MASFIVESISEFRSNSKAPVQSCTLVPWSDTLALEWLDQERVFESGQRTKIDLYQDVLAEQLSTIKFRKTYQVANAVAGMLLKLETM